MTRTEEILNYANSFRGKGMENEELKEIIRLAIIDGAIWADNHPANIWKPADGDDLPEYEREVIVFTQNFPNDAGIMFVAISHRPTPDGWDGKSLTTGKVEHYIPKTYGKGGWSIPDVKYWLDCEIPNTD